HQRPPQADAVAELEPIERKLEPPGALPDAGDQHVLLAAEAGMELALGRTRAAISRVKVSAKPRSLKAANAAFRSLARTGPCASGAGTRIADLFVTIIVP